VATVSDPVTIANLGAGGQLRLVEGGYGVIFRNDSSTFYVMVTSLNDPYGGWSQPYPVMIDLASKSVGIDWAPDSTYALSASSLHSNHITVDAAIHAGSLSVAGGIALAPPGVTGTSIGTNGAGQFQVSNASGSPLIVIDQVGNLMVNEALAVGGQIQTAAAGIRFSDGTVQTTASGGGGGGGGGSSFPGDITVNGTIRGPGTTGQSPILYCFPWTGQFLSPPVNSLIFSHNEGSNWITLWVRKSDGTLWIANIGLTQYA